MAYQANRNYDNLEKNQNGVQPSAEDKKQQKKEQTAEAIKKGAEAYAGAKGGKIGKTVANKALNSKLGNKAVNKVADVASRNPVVPKLANAINKIDDDELKDINKNRNQYNPANQAPQNPSNGKETNEEYNNESGENETPDFSDDRKQNKTRRKFSTSSSSSKDSSSGGVLERGNAIITWIKENKLKASIIGFCLVIGLIFAGSVVIVVTTDESEFEDAYSISSVTSGDTGGSGYGNYEEQRKDFIDRVISVTGADEDIDDFESGEEIEYTDQNYAYLVVVATYHVINSLDNTYNYPYFTKSKIRQIKRQIKSDELSTKIGLANNVFPKYFKNLSQKEYETYADDVFEYIRDYYSYIGKETTTFDPSQCTTITSSKCTYDVKGYYSQGKGNVRKEVNLSSIKVKLVDCDDNKKELSGEGLIDFEKYVLGVAYAELENGEEEAFKAQAIAARNYALVRALSSGAGIKKEGNDNIITISSCTKTQVYCDPDKGCSKKGSNYVSGQDNTVYKKELSGDSKLRSYAKSVEGKVLINEQGYIINTTYSSTEQGQFNSLAKKGKDYKAILLQVYGQKFTNTNVSGLAGDSCNEVNQCIEYGYGATGDYTSWKQGDKSWKSTPLGTSSATIGSAGCLITSIAMQIKRSGVDTSKVGPVFNPGTFVQALNKNGGFDSGGNLYWNKVTTVVPEFKYIGIRDIKGKSQPEKIQILQELLTKNYYVVAEVKGITPYQHWVAVNQVSGNKITMMDPGSSSTDLFKKYGNAGARFAYFKTSGKE